VGVQVKP